VKSPMSAPTKSSDIRRTFLDFFGGHDHRIVQSSSLVPSNDPTLYFTNAGMVQFKDVFTGKEHRPYSRATTVQKVLRVSGKHNDLENVGRTPRHHTFFEMLGNFSFGDYFKKDAIRYAWELLTGPFGLAPERLWVTVYEEDEEALDLWLSLGALPRERIQKLGAADNFWSMGDTGPCGPCSEIHYDHGPEFGPEGGPAVESPRYVELWNLVFMQFDRSADGVLTPLPRPSIDTGAGLERVAAATSGVYSNYDSDCFTPILHDIAKHARLQYGDGGETDVALRVIADHARATAFLVSDGVTPSNDHRGYVLRRIMRRAIRYGVKLGLKEPFFHVATDAVAAHMGASYPELEERLGFMRETVRTEEDRFRSTLGRGLEMLEGVFGGLDGQPHHKRCIPGDVVFRLHDTYGFPPDLTRLIAAERDVGIDEVGYETHMEAQREAGRSAWKGSGEQAVGHKWHELHNRGLRSEFTGYVTDAGDASVTALVKGQEEVHLLETGDVGALVLDRSPFYAESGGQVGDIGLIRTPHGTFEVTDTRRPVPELIVHLGRVVGGVILTGAAARAEVDGARRDRTRKNHTATHLMHAALRAVLGTHVAQKGSLVEPDRLRFDFSHPRAMTQEELDRVEDLVYGQILRNEAVEVEETTLSLARAAGAMALFGEKYGDDVRMVAVPGFSVELCGGTHARRTGDIGLFRVLSEAGVAAGVRRIEAVTGPAALLSVREREQRGRQVADALRSTPDQAPDALQRLLDDRKRLDRELDQLRRELTRLKAGDLLSKARVINGINVLAAEIATEDPAALREEADRLRDQLGNAVIVLGSREGGTVKLVATVSKELAGKRAHAGNIVKQVALLVGGSGGGRPDMAQAGGKDGDALPGALEKVYTLLG
jgi:alanyl-tRNA synthetase